MQLSLTRMSLYLGLPRFHHIRCLEEIQFIDKVTLFFHKSVTYVNESSVTYIAGLIVCSLTNFLKMPASPSVLLVIPKCPSFSRK
jgi:hypothetical protein